MSDFDSSAALFKSRAKQLAALMASGDERHPLWRPEELAAMFRHQMSAPVLMDLGSFDPRTAARLKTLSAAQGLLLSSFADLFNHPAPPIQLLQLVKDFAKANMDHPESGLPREIAAALYYASIAAALVRLDTRISQLADADLQSGLRWTQEQAWLDEKTIGAAGRGREKTVRRQGGARAMSEPQDHEFAPPVSVVRRADCRVDRPTDAVAAVPARACWRSWTILKFCGSWAAAAWALFCWRAIRAPAAMPPSNSSNPNLVTNQQTVHRFLKEAGHLKRLRHTNIVPVEEISDRPEAPYFVMPYFEKGSLASHIKPGQPLSTETILDMAHAGGRGTELRASQPASFIATSSPPIFSSPRATAFAWPISDWRAPCSTTPSWTWKAANSKARLPICRRRWRRATPRTRAAIFIPLARCFTKC